MTAVSRTDQERSAMTLGRPAEWSEERCTELKRMFALDYSMGLMAKELNASRNAVIGKCHRLGLRRLPVDPNKPRQKYYRPAAKLTPKPRHPRPNNNSVSGILRRKKMPVMLSVEPVVDSEIPLSQRKTLMELTDTTCRWPIGEVGRGLFFCGGPADLLGGQQYCPYHMNVAYPPRPAKVMGVAA